MTLENKIFISDISKNQEGLISTIYINGQAESVYVKITDSFKDDLVTDRIDAFVWGFMFFAMCKGYDIESTLPISEELYYNLEYHFIDGMASVNKTLHRIHINAPTCKALDGKKDIVSTGVSCGVDSLFTVAQHTDVPESFKLNTLAFFNAGSSFNGFDEDDGSRILEGRLENARKFTEEYGSQWLYIDTNLHCIIHKHLEYSHVENNTYMALFCVYQIQGRIRNYYYSSGYSYAEFTILREGHNAELDSEHYDLLILQMASVNGMKFYSTGGNTNRFEKTRKVAEFKLSEKYLNVCVDSAYNDSVCFKCVRTLLTLDALGVVDNYRAVFDVDHYKANKKWYLEQMYIEAVFKHNSFYKEILPSYKSELTPIFKLKAILKKACSVIKNRL